MSSVLQVEKDSCLVSHFFQEALEAKSPLNRMMNAAFHRILVKLRALLLDRLVEADAFLCLRFALICLVNLEDYML